MWISTVECSHSHWQTLFGNRPTEGQRVAGCAASGSGAGGRAVGAEWRTCWHGGYELEPSQLGLALASLPPLLLLPLCAAFGLRWLARHRRRGS